MLQNPVGAAFCGMTILADAVFLGESLPVFSGDFGIIGGDGLEKLIVVFGQREGERIQRRN